MPLHKFEVQYLQEISRDLKAAAQWCDDIVADDELNTDNTLVNAACASAYTESAARRLKVVIDAIEIPVGQSEFDNPIDESTALRDEHGNVIVYADDCQ